jgi:3-hydroxyisobutyrate dehydrogenase
MRIGFIGLGQMGRGMANNIQRAGYELVVTDLSKASASEVLAEGAMWAETVEEAAEGCDVLFTSLPTPADVLEVAGRLTDRLRPGAAWFDLSTNSVEVVRRLNAELAETGIYFLDAPVSGGPAGAASGRLAIWVGGPREIYDQHLAVLSVMSDSPTYIGEIGAGTIAKLCHNMASTAMVAVMGEVMTLGVKAGLEPLALWESIRKGAAGRMRAFDNIAGRFLPGKLDPPSFALRLNQKDVNLALQLAREVEVPMRLCTLVADELTEAMNRGWAQRDCHSYLLLQQERANVPPFKLSAEDIAAAMERS